MIPNDCSDFSSCTLKTCEYYKNTDYSNLYFLEKTS